MPLALYLTTFLLLSTPTPHPAPNLHSAKTIQSTLDCLLSIVDATRHTCPVTSCLSMYWSILMDVRGTSYLYLRPSSLKRTPNCIAQRLVQCKDTFKRRLKTFDFNIAFSDQFVCSFYIVYCQTIFVVYCATGHFLVIGALQVPHYCYAEAAACSSGLIA